MKLNEQRIKTQYQAKAQSIGNLMAELQHLIGEHSQDEPLTYGHIGDLALVEEYLQNAVEHMKG
jgi:hypothetical protein